MDSPSVHEQINKPLARLLVELGCTEADAARKLKAAWRRFESTPAQPTDAELLYEAFRA